MKSARDGSSPNIHKIKSTFRTDSMAMIGYRRIGSLIGVDLIFASFRLPLICRRLRLELLFQIIAGRFHIADKAQLTLFQQTVAIAVGTEKERGSDSIAPCLPTACRMQRRMQFRPHIRLFAGQCCLHRFPRYSFIDKFIVQGKLPNPDFLMQFSIC